MYCFVERTALRIASKHELELARKNILTVTKTGRTTGETFGNLFSDSGHVAIETPFGITCSFSSCFSIKNISDTKFFGGGDSGSGVFLEDNKGERKSAIGIAFAYCGDVTYVCKIKEVVNAFQIEYEEQKEDTSENV